MADPTNPEPESEQPVVPVPSGAPKTPAVTGLGSATTDPPPATDTKPQTRVGAKAAKGSKHAALISLIALLVIIGLGGGYYYLHYYKKPKPVTKPTKHDIPLIRIGTQDGPVDTFYPAEESIVTSGFQNVNNQVFEGLVGWKNGARVVPLLATSWTNPDDSTWIFNLRQNVKFHTGHTMTADDVKYSLDNYKGTYSDSLGLTDSIKSVTVVSPTQVKIVTNNPDPLLLNRLTYFYIVDAHATKPNDTSNGTGPYVLKPGTDPVKDKVTDLVAYDGYWGGHAYTRELQFSEFLKETDEVSALKDHKIDLFDSILDLPSVGQLKTAGIKMTAQAAPLVDMIALNTMRKNSPLGNLKFRQALNTGIDRAAIIKAAGVQGTAVGQFMVQEVPGYVPKLTAPAQDITAAKALMAASGVKKPTLTLSYGTDTSNQALLTEFQKQCAVLGVTIKLDPIDNLDDLTTKYLDGKTDMFFFANTTNLFDATDILSIFQLPGVYDNASVDDDLTKSNQTIDGAKRLALLQQAAQTLSDDTAGLPLYTRASFYAQASGSYSVNTEVPGVTLGAYFWKVYQQ